MSAVISFFSRIKQVVGALPAFPAA